MAVTSYKQQGAGWEMLTVSMSVALTRDGHLEIKFWKRQNTNVPFLCPGPVAKALVNQKRETKKKFYTVILKMSHFNILSLHERSSLFYCLVLMTKIYLNKKRFSQFFISPYSFDTLLSEN